MKRKIVRWIKAASFLCKSGKFILTCRSKLNLQQPADTWFSCCYRNCIKPTRMPSERIDTISRWFIFFRLVMIWTQFKLWHYETSQNLNFYQLPKFILGFISLISQFFSCIFSSLSLTEAAVVYKTVISRRWPWSYERQIPHREKREEDERKKMWIRRKTGMDFTMTTTV